MKKAILVFCGLALFFAGALSLPEEGIPYMRRRTARLGPLEATARTREKIAMPGWLSWALILAGAAVNATGAYVKK